MWLGEAWRGAEWCDAVSMVDHMRSTRIDMRYSNFLNQQAFFLQEPGASDYHTHKCPLEYAGPIMHYYTISHITYGIRNHHFVPIEIMEPDHRSFQIVWPIRKVSSKKFRGLTQTQSQCERWNC